MDYNYSSGDVISWTDPTGENHHADFDVDERSPLFQYVGGESGPIRYDPADPDRFYYRDLLKSRVNSAIRTTVTLLAIAVFLICAAWLRLSGRRYSLWWKSSFERARLQPCRK